LHAHPDPIKTTHFAMAAGKLERFKKYRGRFGAAPAALECGDSSPLLGRARSAWLGKCASGISKAVMNPKHYPQDLIVGTPASRALGECEIYTGTKRFFCILSSDAYASRLHSR
jgi:hypothetical protein